jgi:hypothetical protein
MASLADAPFGIALLWLVALGLAGYAVWRLSEAAFDPEGRGATAKGAFERAGSAVSGVSHVLLAAYAVRLALHRVSAGGRSPGDDSAQDKTAWLMAQPGGVWLVGLVSLALFGVAAAQAIKAYRASFLRNLGGDVPAPGYVRVAGRIGYTARAIVFALIGWFFLRAAHHADASEAGGMGQALRRLQAQDDGPLLLGIVAAGLFLFGLYSLVEARFRRIRVRVPTSFRA